MKFYLLPLLLITAVALTNCGSSNDPEKPESPEDLKVQTHEDSILYSFTFLGCNRVDRKQQFDTTATDGSTANLAVLKRIFDAISGMERKPDLFFFLGDMVLAETDTTNLHNQLEAWIALHNNTQFSSISTSGIEMVAVPGNHEMLYYHDYNIPDHDEWPLVYATEVWLRYMRPFMPKDRDRVTGADSMNNRMTFSFVRENVGFILMNTDTYNMPSKENPYGLEGIVPTPWILNKIAQYRKDPKIDHIFVLGHKPYYVSGEPETGHDGLPEGPELWPEFNKKHVAAMLSAHVHDYERFQPGDKGTYQIIAGNGGSKGPATFYGYSMINIMKNGDIELISMGIDKGDPYYKVDQKSSFTVRDQTKLTWTKNANPYQIPKKK